MWIRPKSARSVEGIPIFDLADVERIAKERSIRLAIIAVPGPDPKSRRRNGQPPALKAILNFAPVTLSLSKQVQTIGVDLAIELEQLAFAVANQMPRDRGCLKFSLSLWRGPG